MIQLIIVGISMGYLFGLALEKSRAFEPGVIIRQFELRNFLYLKVLLSAVVTSLIVILIMHQSLGIPFQIKPTYVYANLLGGLLMGVGIVMVGACPATLYVQIGAGYRDALFAFLGGIFGAIFFGFVKGPILNQIFFVGEGNTLQLNQLMGIEYWVMAVLFFFGFLFTLFILEKRRHWQDEVGMNCDGVS